MSTKFRSATTETPTSISSARTRGRRFSAIYCAGVSFDTTPVLQDAVGGHTKFWVTPSGEALADDTSLFRADQSRTECKVTAAGLLCTRSPSTPFGTPGAVVMGGGIDPFSSVTNPLSFGDAACWLESTGEVFCGYQSMFPDQTGATMPVFPGRVALALATQYYTNQICAVFADASVECVRVTIDENRVVSGPSAAAGSAMIGCP